MKLQILLGGLAGTLVMTLFVNLVSIVLKKPFYVVRILARVLRFDRSGPGKSVPYWIALVVHYGIGLGFAWIFQYLLEQDLRQPNFAQTISFGATAGLIGIIGWRIVFWLHPNPPQLNLPQYLFVIWLGHLVYSGGLFLVYSKF